MTSFRILVLPFVSPTPNTKVDPSLPPGHVRLVVGQDFTLSMHKKANFRKFLEGWRGKEFQNDEEFDPVGIDLVDETVLGGEAS